MWTAPAADTTGVTLGVNTLDVVLGFLACSGSTLCIPRMEKGFGFFLRGRLGEHDR